MVKESIKKPKCLLDLMTASYIKIIGNNRAYVCRRIGEWGEAGIYEDGTLIGFLHNSYVPTEFLIKRSVFGIDMEAIIKYKSVMLFGDKSPNSL